MKGILWDFFLGERGLRLVGIEMVGRGIYGEKDSRKVVQ